MKLVFLLGRVLYGGYFLYSGVNHFLNHGMLTGYAGAKGVPQPHVAVSGSGAMLVAGGASVVLGLQPKIGSALIATFLLAVSPQMHNFWGVEDPNQRMVDMINFTKNMALVGAALALMATPEPWPLSLGSAEPDEAAESRRFAA